MQTLPLIHSESKQKSPGRRKSKELQDWMKRQHTCSLCHGFHSASLWMEPQVQTPALQNCWAKATFVWPGGCTVTWRHPAGLCTVWGRAQVHCACTRPGSSCHVTSIVPGSERTTLARSQRGRVWEKDSAANPEECWEDKWRVFLSKLFAEKNILERKPLLWVILSQISECTKTHVTGDLSTRHRFKNYFRKCSETRWVGCRNESHYMNRQFANESFANKQFLIVWQHPTQRSHDKLWRW